MKTKTLRQISVARKVILCTVVLYLLAFFALNASKISADNIMRLFYDFECVIKDKTVNETVEFEESDNNYFTSFKNGLITLTNTGISVYNEKNILISDFSANYTNSAVKTAGDHILVFERGGTDIYRTNSFEVENSVKLSENIVNASVDGRGYTAVITDSYGYKGKLTVYNKNFEELYYWSTTSSYPIYAEFVGGSAVAVISVRPDKESCDTAVTLINYSTGEEVGNFTEKNVFPADIYKNQDGSIDVFTTAGIYRLTLDKFEKIADNTDGDISHYSLGEKYTVLSHFDDKSKNISTVNAYNKNGELLFSENIENLKSVACNSNYIFAAAGNTVYVFNGAGEKVSEEQKDFNIQEIVPAENGAFLIGTDCAVKVNVG